MFPSFKLDPLAPTIQFSECPLLGAHDLEKPVTKVVGFFVCVLELGIRYIFRFLQTFQHRLQSLEPSCLLELVFPNSHNMVALTTQLSMLTIVAATVGI